MRLGIREMSDQRARNFLVERDQLVATVVINRPERRNALRAAMWAELAKIIEDLAKDDSVRVIVLRGAGRVAFCAGADISELAGEQPNPAQQAVFDPMDAIAECPKAVISMAFGYAMGGGCALALACDLCIAGESARFSIPAARLGIVYPAQRTSELVARVGVANATHILFTGDPVDAQTARDMGIAAMVFPDDRLEEETYILAHRITRNAPISIAGAKRIIRAGLRDRASTGRELDEWTWRSLSSADRREGARAFLERREPEFRGN